ncbi:MAG TPA: arylamine N-acetyltransferase, partial [Anaerolineales bacterium]|nr:arylamine N-acetyltransferase [Anaerolineales bacterium]
IRIVEEAIYNKIVHQNRGGFCYELNGLFAWLLQEIGFDVTYLNARVFKPTGELGIPFGHLALLVQIPGQQDRWLTDVGFGDSFTQPLPFEVDKEHIDGLRAYRIEKHLDGYVMSQKDYEGIWDNKYYFNLQPHTFPKEFMDGCKYHQTSPKSSFTHGSIISKATPDGRISLENNRLIITRNGQKTESAVNSKIEYHALLKEHFSVTIQKETP